MIVKIIANDKGNPPGKLADAELHFTDGPLDGLKLIGFGIWERRTGGGRNVTFPARSYAVNGERRSFALLRPSHDMGSNVDGQARIREMILEAYAAEYDEQPAPVPVSEADARGRTAGTNAQSIDQKYQTAGSQLGNATARALRF